MNILQRLFTSRPYLRAIDSCPYDAPDNLIRHNMALVHGLVPNVAALSDFAFEKLVSTRNPGNNLMLFISQPDGGAMKTDFSLVRQIINRRVAAIASSYFQRVAGTRDFVMPLNNLVVRHFDRSESATPDLIVPFHQDGRAFPDGFFAINCWTLLYPDECGHTSPGLDFCPAPLRIKMSPSASPVSKHYASLEPSEPELARLVKQYGIITPSIRLGDIMMFNELAPHRTSISPIAAPKPRVSAEIRVVAANACAKEAQVTSGHAYAHVSNGRITWPSIWELRAGAVCTIVTQVADLSP